MKTFKVTILLFLISILFINCSSEKDATAPIIPKIDDSYLYDQDENCVTARGTCCDIDGRILVEPNSTYTYTHTFNRGLYSVDWTVLSGDITLVSGQNTNSATFKFGNNFTTGQISAFATAKINGLECENRILVSKL